MREDDEPEFDDERTKAGELQDLIEDMVERCWRIDAYVAAANASLFEMPTGEEQRREVSRLQHYISDLEDETEQLLKTTEARLSAILKTQRDAREIEREADEQPSPAQMKAARQPGQPETGRRVARCA